VRIQAQRQRTRRKSWKQGERAIDEWLSPLELERRERSLGTKSKRRASDRGFLSLSLDHYLGLAARCSAPAEHEKERERRACKWLQGISHAREAFN